MRIRIEGTDLPGRTFHSAGERLENVHVGVQRGREVVDPVPGDAPEAVWDFEVSTRLGDDAAVDVGGPYVHGRPGARFLYLSWGTVDAAGGFRMARRAKLHLEDVAPAMLTAAADGGGTLVARLALTDRYGGPVCARVRPPTVTWRVTS